MDAVTKSAFAETMGVSAGRVSQWLKSGQIPPEALVGEGRYAKILPDVARQHLRTELDVSQMTGNGLATKLDTPSAPSSFEDQLRSEKLEQAQIQTRRMRADEAARSGKYVLAQDAEAAMAKMAARLIAYFEGGLSDMSAAIAAELKVPQRDAVHVLRKQFKQLRERAEAQARTELAATSQYVTDETTGSTPE